jgi:signal peptidase I
VLRAFLVEAFVIPTGSMAERLYGEHFMLRCPACQYEYAYGVQDDDRKVDRYHFRPVGAICPNCDFPYADVGLPAARRAGDRVLVLKYLYQFSEPRPWDVVVFKNPQNNHENYIKRLIGLPGETLEIVHGDIYIAESPDGPFRIRRKPDRVQEVMWQVVCDADFPPNPELIEQYNRKVAAWNARQSDAYLSKLTPPAFVPASPEDRHRWTRSQKGRVVQFTGQAGPGRLQFNGGCEDFRPWYGYNPRRLGRAGRIDLQRDVINDLKLAISWQPQGPDSQVCLELSSFEHVFQAVFQADRTVLLRHRTRLYPDGFSPWETWGRVRAKIEPGSIHRIALTHADFRVTAWLDGRAVIQTTDQQYTADHEQISRRMLLAGQIERLGQKAAEQDASEETRIAHSKAQHWFQQPPSVQIHAEGGPSQLRHIQLMRDVYYTSTNLESLEARGRNRHELLYAYARNLARRDRQIRNRFAQDGPWANQDTGWAVWGNPLTLRKDPNNPDLDEFFVMGDNSPQSHDGRNWTMASPTLRLYDDQGNPQYQLGTVPRYNLLGRAMFVYWPSGFRVPGLPRISLIPNVGRMRFIK